MFHIQGYEARAHSDRVQELGPLSPAALRIKQYMGLKIAHMGIGKRNNMSRNA